MLLLSVSNEVDLLCGFVIGTQGAAIYSPAPQSSSRPPTARYTVAMSLCVRPSDDTSTHVSAIRTGSQEDSSMVIDQQPTLTSTAAPKKSCQAMRYNSRYRFTPGPTDMYHMYPVHLVSKAHQIREQHVHRSSLPARAPCFNL